MIKRLDQFAAEIRTVRGLLVDDHHAFGKHLIAIKGLTRYQAETRYKMHCTFYFADDMENTVHNAITTLLADSNQSLEVNIYNLGEKSKPIRQLTLIDPKIDNIRYPDLTLMLGECESDTKHIEIDFEYSGLEEKEI